ncbi:hypothetical protein [Phytohabitans houttuyneae]|uniref:hypothetical protein n=1 Tax=Phytohabitans houttuyneae TaxID=1076126 RepID=UPI0015665CC9|nr:hypothetical protein [Phytohabitans houttuyneae]
MPPSFDPQLGQYVFGDGAQHPVAFLGAGGDLQDDRSGPAPANSRTRRTTCAGVPSSR